MKNGFKVKTLAEIQSDQIHSDNFYGLVYRGAITENKEGRVNIHPISYESLTGLKIAANVYTPANYQVDENKKYSAICLAHPNVGVKEQVAGLYAQRLAENGYITLVADAAYQGGSEGEPRNTDKPANRIEDIHRMADIIAQYPGVDSERIGILGICGGGGYTLKAVQTDKRFKAVATLSMFNTGIVRRDGFCGSQLDTIQERLLQATKARIEEVNGKEVLYTPDMLEMSEEEVENLPYDLYREGYEYYGKTHHHPKSTFRYTVSSLLDLMSFDAADNAALINQPLLMMAGSHADTLYMTKRLFTKATGTKKKELFLIEGATHIETYWNEAYVNQAMTKLLAFFNQYL